MKVAILAYVRQDPGTYRKMHGRILGTYRRMHGRMHGSMLHAALLNSALLNIVEQGLIVTEIFIKFAAV